MKRDYECACERGDSCTKTTICAIQNALEDQFDEIYSSVNALGGVACSPKEVVEARFLDEVLAAIEKLRP